MLTQLVYVVVNDENIYFEQALLSAWSARQYNYDAKIIFLCDPETNDYCNKYYEGKYLKSIIDRIDVMKLPEGLNAKEKSRWIKTSAREFIDGDMLQIDTDTIICGDIKEIDEFSFDMAAVLDYHCELKNAPYLGRVKRMSKKIFGLTCNEFNSNYFNSGVIFSKDSDKSRLFYRKWHQNWQEGLEKGYVRDQLAFYKTMIDIPISELDGIYNCMVRTSIKYLNSAKIIHFFNADWGSEDLSPFFKNDIYKEIKDNGIITENIKQLALDCKSSFVSPSVIMGGKDAEILFSPAFILFKVWKKQNNALYKMINNMARIVLKLKGM